MGMSLGLPGNRAVSAMYSIWGKGGSGSVGGASFVVPGIALPLKKRFLFTDA